MKNARAIFVIAFLASVLGAPAAALADHVVLTNGDSLTGTISSVSGTSLTIDTELAGRVSVKWSAVSQATPDIRVRAALPNGQTVEGPATVTGGRLTVQAPGGAPVAIELASVRGLELSAAVPAGPRWHGALNAGVDISRGNSETSTVSTNGAATREGRRDRLGLFGTYLFSAVGSGTDAVTTARASRGGLRYDHDLLGSLFGFGFGDIENDPLQLLDWRTVLGGGLGAHLVKTDITQVNLFAGVSFASDSYASVTAGTSSTTTPTTPTTPTFTPPGKGGTPPGLSGIHPTRGGTPPGLSGIHPTRGGTPPALVRTSLSRDVGEFLIGEDYAHQLTDSVSLTEAFRFFPAMSDFQDYRISFDLSLSAQLNGWLQWNVTVADRYLNIPPAGGAVQNDTFVSTGLGITFGSGMGTYTGADARPPAPPRR